MKKLDQILAYWGNRRLIYVSKGFAILESRKIRKMAIWIRKFTRKVSLKTQPSRCFLFKRPLSTYSLQS